QIPPTRTERNPHHERTIHPTASTTPGCTNPATGTHPYNEPGDQHDHACTACHAAYLEALTARDDD
ncbi:hypothetical protein, partial [Nocardia cyriacigeorgica]|uniref:hypothetical protein n=1 Tax=Nocardia cyriacigeorgica TaxID=135487 RepID=UPI0024568933